MRHPHADIAIEWFQDTSRVVQYFWNNQWTDWDRGSDPHFSPNCQWRFRPEPKPDVVRYARAMMTLTGWRIPDGTENLKVTFSGEDGKLIKAEVIGD